MSKKTAAIQALTVAGFKVERVPWSSIERLNGFAAIVVSGGTAERLRMVGRVVPGLTITEEHHHRAFVAFA